MLFLDTRLENEIRIRELIFQQQISMIASRYKSWFSYLQNKEKIYEVKIKVKSKQIRALCSSSTIAAAIALWSFLFIIKNLLGIFVF